MGKIHTTKGVDDLLSQRPDLAAELFEGDPSEIFVTGGKKVKWKCNLGHIYETSPNIRVWQKSGCSYCFNKKVLSGFNDLQTRFPEIAASAYGWDPTTILPFSGKQRDWQCDEGHIWNASVGSRTNMKSGCPYCSGRIAIPGVNDLKTIDPRVASQAYGWDPSRVLSYSNIKMDWICDIGHIWDEAPSPRRRNNSGCPYCANFRILPGFNDILTTHPKLASQLFDTDPTTIHAGHSKKVTWICGLGHKWDSAPNTRSRQNLGCPTCSGQKLLPGYNDLATVYPKIAAEAISADTTRLSPGTAKKIKWMCPEGHEYVSAVGSRTGPQKTGCPTCAHGGFSPSLLGYLYLLRHHYWGLLKIGISNDPKNRTREHGQTGFRVLEIMGPMDGQQANDYEQAILRHLRSNGADVGNKGIAGNFDGYTECWVEETYPAKSLQELLDAVGELV
jgi:hypothetical protein